jgi:glycosyltransferase involved in cell wall biosynthesis
MARISIITRTFDRPVLLARTFRTLAAQTYTDWECIVVNGGQESSVQQALVGIPISEKVRIIPYSGPKGMRGAPLNFGIQQSQADYITILDDDDTWEPEFLQRMLTTLEHSSHGAQGIVCHSQIVHETSVEEGLATTSTEPLNADLHCASLARLAVQNCWCIHAFIYRRVAYDSIAGYSEKLPVLEDWDYNLRFLLKHDVLVLPEMLTHYHLRQSVKTGAEANSQHGEVDAHKFYDAHIRNEALRADLAVGRTGLGMLLATAGQAHWLERRIHRVEGKVKAASEKIGKIDARTKELKDRR